ncbi:MAG: glycosyltransferase involved in cell wall biosynthesis [Candidatus Azotimanducaceae bacterium]|jgi:glycosyltransferase involved in cell wall biosynthesis
MYNKKIFIVVGMHRSGTSLVTNCLKSFGLKLSENLVPCGPDNPDGFFEDSEIVRFNSQLEEILSRSHMTPSSVLPLPEGWQADPAISSISANIKDYLSAAVDENSPFLLKDPRICNLLPLYIQIFGELKVRPVIIFVNRQPASVVRSKSNRDDLDPSIVELQWQLANFVALDTIFKNSVDVCFVNFETLLRDTKKELDRLEVFLSAYISISKKPPFPVIRKGKIVDVGVDNEDIRLSKQSNELAAFLLTLEERRANTLLPAPKEFGRLLAGFNNGVKCAMPWIDVLSANSPNINLLQETERSRHRLTKSLKEANNALFGASERIEVLNTKLAREKLAFSQMFPERESLQKSLTDLKKSLTDLKMKYGRITQLNKTKIFRVAHGLQSLKTNLFVRPSKAIVYKAKSSIYQVKQKMMLVRRSLLSNGLMKTLYLIKSSLKQGVLGIVRGRRTESKKAHSQFKIIREQQKRFLEAHMPELDDKKVALLLDLFLPEYYRVVAKLDDQISAFECLKHFVEVGLEQGIAPFPLFNSSHYLKKISPKKVALEHAFIHWLTIGVDNRIIPTILFDEDYFIKRHSLVLKQDEWAYLRFVTQSVYRNATPNQYFEPNWYLQHHDLDNKAIPAFYHYLSVGYKIGWRPSPSFPAFSREQCAQMELSPMESIMKSAKFDELRERTSSSGLITKLVSKAALLEPKIAKPHAAQRLNILPYNNPLYPAVRDIRQSLKSSHYTSIVLIPHCRYGGSGLVAGELCRSLLRIDASGSVLLVRTDNDDFMRPDWFPDKIDILNLRDFGCDLPDYHRKMLLLDLLIGLKPQKIFNVHSRLGWEVFTEFGDRLRSWSRLFAYAFCYDMNLVGKKVGYPVKYVPDAIEYLDKLIVDNTFLKNDLGRVNKWNAKTRSKVSVLWTPYQETVDNQMQGVRYTAKEADGSRKVIFWAGRFDRQKRFDLVVKIAKKNPDLDFYVWGAAMLGDEEDPSKLPVNIFLHGLFESYTEIPFEKCSAWLYTSQWDGVPTILIELGLRGVPLVASRIWGTADLIDETTAWPVDEIGSVEAYSKGIRWILKNPAEARLKSDLLRSKILDRHNHEAYDMSLSAIILEAEAEVRA